MIQQWRNHFFEQGFLIKFLKNMSDALEKLDLIGVVLAIQKFQIFYCLKQRILKPLCMHYIIELSSRLRVLIEHWADKRIKIAVKTLK